MTWRPLRVLVVVQRYLPELGGLETHVAEVTSRLAASPDFDMTILTTDRSGGLAPRDVIDGVPVVRKRSWPRNRDYYFSPGLVREIARGRWDVVHFQGVHTLVPALGMLAARWRRLPYLLTFHSGGHSSAARRAMRGLQFTALASSLRRAGRLIAVSRFEQRAISAATGIGDDHFAVIGNGGALPPAPSDVRPIPGRIVSSGRLEQYKGHHRAIEALPKIRAEMPNAELVILGSGPYEAELRSLAEHHGVQDAVAIRAVPPGDRSAMAAELAAASAMAALSTYEAHPVGVMEAVAVGLPVVGLDVAGTGDLVEDGLVTGIPVTASVDDVAAALVTALRAAESADARTGAAVGTWDTCAEKVADLYREVAGSTGVTPVSRPS